MSGPSVNVNATAVLALAGLAVGGWVLWRGSRVAGELADGVKQTLGGAAAAVGDAANAVNPLNDQNIIYRAANVLTGGGGGTDDKPLGARFYEWWHGDEFLAWTPPEKTAAPSWSTQGGQFNNPSAYVAPPQPTYANGAGADYEVPGLPDYFAP